MRSDQNHDIATLVYPIKIILAFEFWHIYMVAVAPEVERVISRLTAPPVEGPSDTEPHIAPDGCTISERVYESVCQRVHGV